MTSSVEACLNEIRRILSCLFPRCLLPKERLGCLLTKAVIVHLVVVVILVIGFRVRFGPLSISTFPTAGVDLYKEGGFDDDLDFAESPAEGKDCPNPDLDLGTEEIFSGGRNENQRRILELAERMSCRDLNRDNRLQSRLPQQKHLSILERYLPESGRDFMCGCIRTTVEGFGKLAGSVNGPAARLEPLSSAKVPETSSTPSPSSESWCSCEIETRGEGGCFVNLGDQLVRVVTERCPILLGEFENGQKVKAHVVKTRDGMLAHAFDGETFGQLPEAKQGRVVPCPMCRKELGT